MNPLHEAGITLTVGGLLIIVGVLTARRIDVPGELWALLSATVGYWIRGPIERLNGRGKRR